MAEGVSVISPDSRYYCYNCSREVFPIHAAELTCPNCSTGFLEEVSSDLSSIEEVLRPDYLAMFNVDVDDFTVTEDDLDILSQISSSEGPSFGAMFVGMDDPAEGYMGYRHFEDYIFENELDDLATRILNDVEICGPPPLPKEQIKQLPLVLIAKEHLEKGLQCTICMDDFRLKEKAKRLPCEHLYHEKCITPWLERQSTCPNCRKIINIQCRNRRSRSCPRSSQNSGNNDRRFSESTSLSDFFTTSLNPFRFL